MIFTIFCVFVLIFFVATVIYVNVFDFDVVEFLNSLIKFAGRGFDNTEKITFNVNEQINLGGDSSYYITKEKYIGKSKKPESITYYDSKYCTDYDATSSINGAYYYEDYQIAMDFCQRLKSRYDNKELEKMQREERKKLSTVHITNKYTI